MGSLGNLFEFRVSPLFSVPSILNSTFLLLTFLVRLRFRTNDDTRDAVIARLAKAASDRVQSLGH